MLASAACQRNAGSCHRHDDDCESRAQITRAFDSVREQRHDDLEHHSASKAADTSREAAEEGGCSRQQHERSRWHRAQSETASAKSAEFASALRELRAFRW